MIQLFFCFYFNPNMVLLVLVRSFLVHFQRCGGAVALLGSIMHMHIMYVACIAYHNTILYMQAWSSRVQAARAAKSVECAELELCGSRDARGRAIDVIRFYISLVEIQMETPPKN